MLKTSMATISTFRFMSSASAARPSPSLLVLGASLMLFGTTACVQPTNPCDPESDRTIQGTTTLRGLVVNDFGAPAPGVTVAISGRSETTVSGEDGTFLFEELVSTQDGLELVALPPAPALGGRAQTPPLACREVVGTPEEPAVTLRIIAPPPPPEVEITNATDRNRLFAAFGSVGSVDVNTVPSRHDTGTACSGDDRGDPNVVIGEHTYTLQVRAPFRAWQDALISTDPRDALDDNLHTLLDEGRIARGFNEACGVAFCDHFAFVHGELATEPTARCAEIVGAVSLDASGNEVFQRLESFGSYEVRVRATYAPPQELVAQQVPSRISSPEVPTNVSLTLVPSSVLPVILGETASSSNAAVDRVDIEAIVPTGDGRFAVLDTGGMKVVSSGSAATEFASDNDSSHGEAMGIDATTSDRAEDEVEGTERGHALAVLPAGKWVRVWKRLDNGAGETQSMIDKIFIGATDGEEQGAPAGAEPRFDFEVSSAGFDSFRGISWLTRPSGNPNSDDYDPEDGYMLLFKRGFVLTSVRGEQMGAFEALMTEGESTLPVLDWALGLDGQQQGLGGFCGNMNATGMTSALVQVCFDIESVFGAPVNLRAVEILGRADSETVHVFADAANDQMIAVRTAALLNRLPGRLIDKVQLLPVGSTPTAIQRSAVLHCDGDTEVSRSEVLLVANAGSGDISILESTGATVGPMIQEMAAIPLDVIPRRFIADPIGPTCKDPFTWVTGDGGEAVPLDMRAEKLDAPRCGQSHCRVATGTRSPVGAMSRASTGRVRALVGGRGVLGELNYLRPAQ